MENTTFAKRLNEALEQRGLKQVDLIRAAEAAGVKLGKSQVSQYVSGKAVPRKNIMAFLAGALGVETEWLCGASDVLKERNILKEQKEFGVPKGEVKMREFKKSTKLDNVLYDVRGPVVDEAARMEENGTSVLKLNIGNPAPFGFRTPVEVIYYMHRQLTECEG